MRMQVFTGEQVFFNGVNGLSYGKLRYCDMPDVAKKAMMPK